VGETLHRTLQTRRDVGQLAPERLILIGAAERNARHLLPVAAQRGLERRRNQQSLVGLREDRGQVVHPLAQQPESGGAMQSEGRRHGLRCYERVPVHISARPTAEANGRPRRRPRRAKPPRDLRLELWHGVEQHGLEEEQNPSHLLLDSRAQPADGSGLPPHGEHLAQLILGLAPLRAAEAVVIEALHRGPHGLLMVEHRASRRVGRVSGHHQADIEMAECGSDLSLRAQCRSGARRRERLALRAAGIGVILAAPAQPLDLLGDVRKLQLHRACPHIGLERGRAQARDEPDKRLCGRLVAVAQPRSCLAQPEDTIAKRATFLLLEHLTQQRFEQSGITVQSLHGECAL